MTNPALPEAQSYTPPPGPQKGPGKQRRQISWGLPYGLAVLAVALALMVTLRLNGSLESTPTLLFFTAVIVSAKYGGLGPGLLAAALSALAINYFWIAPLQELKLLEGGTVVRLATLGAVAVLIHQLKEAQRSAHRGRALIQQAALIREQSLYSELQATNAQLETVLASIDDQFLVLDREWRYVYVSDHALEVTGKLREDLLGRSIFDVFPDTLGTQFQAELQRAVAEQRVVQFEYFYPGWERWFENRVYPSASRVSILVTDITERKRAQAALRESEERFQLLVSNMPGMVYRYTPKSDGTAAFTYISQGSRELVELEPETILQDANAFLSLIHPEDWPAYQAAVDIAVAKAAVWEWEGRLITPSGQLKWVQGRSQPQKTEYGQAWDGLFLDISDRKQAEAALCQSETTLSALIASSPIGIALFDRDLRYLHINEALAATNGLPLSDHLGRTLWEVLPDWAPALAPVLQRVMDTKEPLLDQEVVGITQPTDRSEEGSRSTGLLTERTAVRQAHRPSKRQPMLWILHLPHCLPLPHPPTHPPLPSLVSPSPTPAKASTPSSYPMSLTTSGKKIAKPPVALAGWDWVWPLFAISRSFMAAPSR